MRLLVTGAGGQLATDLMTLVPGRPAFTTAVAYGIGELDLTDAAAVRKVLAREAAEPGELVVVNAAAWTDVDGAETQEAAAYAVNATAVAHLASACAAVGAPLVHVSTDYVFAGDRPPEGPAYTPDDVPDPKTAYGRTKLAGEQVVRALLPETSWVVRTAWVYGPGRNFVTTMTRLAAERDTLTVVEDQRGSPTWSRDLAAGLLELLEVRPAPGVLHATGGGETTWHGFARAIFAELGLDPERVAPTTSAAYASATPRPSYSVLSGAAWEAAGLTPLPPWQAALAAARREPGAVPGYSSTV